MTQTQWTAVDNYINDLLVLSDSALDATIQSTIDAELPQINVAPNQGKLLHILAQIQGARSILEAPFLDNF